MDGQAAGLVPALVVAIEQGPGVGVVDLVVVHAGLLGAQLLAALPALGVQDQHAVVAGVRDVEQPAVAIQLHVAGDAVLPADLARQVATDDAVAVVVEAGAVVHSEVVARDAGVLPVEDPVDVVVAPGDAHAVGALVQHVQVRAQVHVLAELVAQVLHRRGVGLTEDGAVRAPQGGAHEVVRAALTVVGVPALVAGGEGAGGPEGDGAHVVHEVQGVGVHDVDGVLVVGARVGHDGGGVVVAADHPELAGHVGVEGQVPGQVQAVVVAHLRLQAELVDVMRLVAQGGDAGGLRRGVLVLFGTDASDKEQKHRGALRTSDAIDWLISQASYAPDPASLRRCCASLTG